ncbi:MAG: hypothetical protein QNK36_07810 [Colwellia sp.]|nr:hypothetical protein [Colwellia sp.]
MNTLNYKNISVALLITISAFFSLNTYAAETASIESSISELVIAQGKQMMSELSAQLQKSITAEINSFTIDFSFDETMANSLAWINGEEQTSNSAEIENNKVESK